MSRSNETMTAALAATALAAVWIASRQPKDAPVLAPGFGRWTTPPIPAIGAPVPPPASPATPIAAPDALRDAAAEPPGRAPTPAARAVARRAAATRLSGLELGPPRRGLFAEPPRGREAAPRPAPGRVPGSAPARADRPSFTTSREPSRAAGPRRTARSDAPRPVERAEPPPPRAGHEPPRRSPTAALVSGRGAGQSFRAAGEPGARPRSARAAGSPFGAPRSRAALSPASGAARREARFRPLLLSKLLGPRPLKPPPADWTPPAALSGLDARRPARDARGAPVPDAAASLLALEDVDPAALARDRRATPHWDGEQWHAGAARGMIRGRGWAWLYRDGPRWWARAGSAPPLVRHDGVWWTKQGGFWFVLHDGVPWAWRPFRDWDAQGLLQPGTGTEMVYSKDFKTVALVTPGAGAEVFDAATGVLIGRIPEARMPPRRRPKIPESLTLPPDVFVRPPSG